MQTIKRRLSILFFICSIASIILTAMFVNITVNNKFNEYMIETQEKRAERIVSYLEDIYKKEGKWTKNSGTELMHEAYMSNYCLTLEDINKDVIWLMDVNEIIENLNTMNIEDMGVYISKTYEIKSNGAVVGYITIGQYSSVLLSEEDISFKSSINKSIVVSGIFTLMIVVMLSLYFSKQFSNPIKEVANMSVNLSKGKFDVKYSDKSNIEELDNLRKSINILALKLKQQDELRKKIISDISHEIRTPLNVLENNLEAMIDGIFPVTSDRLANLNDEVIRFGRLLDDLNILKEFESENIKLNLEALYLDELIEDICNDFKIAAESKNIKIVFNKQLHADYRIVGDMDKLKQVFINLISNSVKFTESEGKVELRMFIEMNHVVVEVIDEGIGIPKEDLPFIYERLYRADKSRNITEGNGIGLTIVKSILQLHNATIDVESVYGKGTVFKLNFTTI